MERAQFFASPDEPLAPYQNDNMCHLIQRRLEGEPLAYIFEHREFYGLDFVVNPHVLIPRQETELLVDKVLELAATDGFGRHLDIADVGTGSGCVAVAIARSLERATLYATDIRFEALAVADINRRKHGVSDRVHVCQGDLFEALHGPVDIIVSNPPYIETSEIRHLQPEVRREPPSALDGGADGLEITGRLLRDAPAYIRAGGCILVEIAPEQLGPVSRIAREAMPEASISFSNDLLGLPRMVSVKSPGYSKSWRPTSLSTDRVVVKS
jgi:release factor glutamine methyltransferase